MRWTRLVPLPFVFAVAACGSSGPHTPPDASRVPASLALTSSDFPEGYEFHDDQNLRSLDATELGTKSKGAQSTEDLEKRDPRLFDYSKLTLDYLSADQQPCAALMDLGRRPMRHTEAGPVVPASANSRSSLGYNQRSMTSLVFTVTREPVPVAQYRETLAGCGQFAAASDKFGEGQAAMKPADAPDGGFAYDLQAQLQSPSGLQYKLSRVLVAVPVGQYTVLGAVSRADSASDDKGPIDQTTLRAMLQKLVDKVKKG